MNFIKRPTCSDLSTFEQKTALVVVVISEDEEISFLSSNIKLSSSGGVLLIFLTNIDLPFIFAEKHHQAPAQAMTRRFHSPTNDPRRNLPERGCPLDFRRGMPSSSQGPVIISINALACPSHDHLV